MKKIVSTALLALAACSANVHAQGVGINATGAAADTSAILDLSATNKGLLVPRMTAAQRAAIVLPATGLVVFQTDGTAGLYYNAGTSASPSWQAVGAGVTSGQWSTSGSNLYYSSGNVGIGTSSPTAPLGFPATMGKKITLFPAGSGDYGFSIAPSRLQIHAEASGQDVAIGYDAAGTFAERFTIKNNGALALSGVMGTAGQVLQSNGPNAPATWGSVSQPWTLSGLHLNYASGNVGIQRATPLARLDVLGGNWDLASTEGDVRIGDSSYRMKFGVATAGGGAGGATIMQQGLAGGYNVLALGSQGNKVAFVNGNSSRFGIGNDNPTAPLGFAASTGKKISLFPAVSGDYGFSIAPNRLQIHAEAAGTDVAIGYDAAGTFTERLAVKNNGALAVSGNAGTAGQVLQSNGPGGPPTWVSPTATQYQNIYTATSTTRLALNAASSGTIPDMNLLVPVQGTAKLLVSFSVPVDGNCSVCGNKTPIIRLYLDGQQQRYWFVAVGPQLEPTATGTCLIDVAPGIHTVRLDANTDFNGPAGFGTGAMGGSNLIVQVIPQ